MDAFSCKTEDTSQAVEIPPDPVTLARRVRDGDGLAVRIVTDAMVDLFALPAAGDVVIGRGSDADVRIDDTSISRKHALLANGPLLRIPPLHERVGEIGPLARRFLDEAGRDSGRTRGAPVPSPALFKR